MQIKQKNIVEICLTGFLYVVLAIEYLMRSIKLSAMNVVVFWKENIVKTGNFAMTANVKKATFLLRYGSKITKSLTGSEAA